jgi:hypothetical protein
MEQSCPSACCFAGQNVEVTESTLELAKMTPADHGEFSARGLLRKLIPTPTFLEAGAAVAEAKRRRLHEFLESPTDEAPAKIPPLAK